MTKKETSIVIPQEQIIHKIVLLREEKVMLDVHLAEMYGVETRALKQAVRRNIDLFPNDFMFELTPEEIEIVVSQNVIPSRQHLGGSMPFAFTETGVAMLSSVLKSKRAKEMNIAIMRAFIALRKMLLTNTELRLEIAYIKRRWIIMTRTSNWCFNTWTNYWNKKRSTIRPESVSATNPILKSNGSWK